MYIYPVLSERSIDSALHCFHEDRLFLLCPAATDRNMSTLLHAADQ